jgi:TldD protein
MMKELLKYILEEAASQGADYADVRYCQLQTESIRVKNAQVEGVDFHTDQGLSVRVMVNGNWGFASNPEMDNKERLQKMVERAIELARAAGSCSHQKLSLSNKEVCKDKWESSYLEDPFRVPLDEKLELLLSCCKVMHAVDGVSLTSGSISLYREFKHYMDTEGTETEQTVTHSGAGISCTSFLGNEMNTRSYPSNFRGNHQMAGYEFVRSLNLMENASRIASEAVELHKAIACPSGEMELIIGGSQLVLQVHESCGHPVEMDRVLGYEANFAGTSFLTLEKLGSFRYGSEKVNIVQDGTVPNGIGTLKYDDDGVPCTRSHIIKNGIFSGYLTSRDNAQFDTGVPNGASRAQGWNNAPIVRMTNINLEPGDETLDELISSTKRGIMMSENSSWSIDDKRLNFQFGCEVGWLIENGKIKEMVKKPVYRGITPKFWAGCEGVANKDHWSMWGTPHCGKGQPMQVARVGHGVSYAKFKNVTLGVSS